MGSRPAFDPNTYNAEKDVAVFTDPLVEGRYEMGSIMKPLTMAAGIDTGAITPQTTYNDKGCIKLNNKTVCNYDKKARGVIPMQEVLNHSLNLGATFVADTMGHPAFTRYMHAYQFDQKTGIDLPNEVSGSLSSLGDGTGADVNYSNASFGQGVAESAMEMTRALAVLANDGKLPSPHLVTGIKYVNGITRAVPIPTGVQVLKPETAHTVTDMLIKVFDNALLNGKIKQEHYSMAAKTGTAQMAGPDGKYYGDRYLHSFFGYFPAHDPKYIIFLFTVEPHGVQYASETLAMPYLSIAQFLINYYSIPPDR
jgi:cell division protein FtsI/penicillin-binding protein 2